MCSKSSFYVDDDYIEQVFKFFTGMITVLYLLPVHVLVCY